MAGTNTQFAVALHILAGLGCAKAEDLTSTDISSSVNACPSFVRRVLAKLSKAGLVRAIVGKGGTCSLARPAAKITLLDVYRAVGAPPFFALHGYEVEKRCPVSCNIKGALSGVFTQFQKTSEKSLDEITLAEVIRNFKT